MDYIQKDLDLIRMASGEVAKDEKGKKPLRKDKTSSKASHARAKSETGVKTKLKPGRKSQSSNRAASNDLVEKEKDKKGRRSLVGRPPGKKSPPVLGKIRLPNIKKANPSLYKASVKPSTPGEASPKRSTGPTKLSPAVKSSPAAVHPPPVENHPSRVGPAKKRRFLDPDAVPIDGICFEEGARIEAVDHGQWYRAKIVKVDREKMDILVHFDGWGPRFDTWFPMTSSLIRGRTELDAKPDTTKYESGEDVLAKWTDGNFYPATVLTVKDSGSCQVMYFDGMKKLLRPNLIKKMSEGEKEAAMQAAQKLLLALPVDIGNPVSSDPDNAATPKSEFRKYKTSANDRERRIAARGSGLTPTSTPKVIPGKKRGRKRKAPAPIPDLVKPSTAMGAPKEKSVNSSPNKDAASSKRLSSDDDAFHAKKARLDKIASNLVSKVSPVSDKDKESPKISWEGESPKTSVKKDNDTKTDISVRPLKFHHESSQSSCTQQSVETNLARESCRKSPILSGDHSMQNESPSSRKLVSPTDVEMEKRPEQPQSAENGEMITRSSEQSNSTQSEESEYVAADTFKVGDYVLAKWLDCRSYLAYIMEKESNDQYKIRYYDGMVKVVKASFIHPWVGPLPDSLKSFKPKETAPRKQRSKSNDLKSARSGGSSSTALTSRRRTISVAKRTEVSPPPIRRKRQSESKETVPDADTFVIGQKVIAKWTDLKWYPATVVSKKDHEHYEVRYHDKMTKIVRDTWLNHWTPREVSLPTKDSREKKDTAEEVKSSELQKGELQFSTPLAKSDEKGRKRLTLVPGSSVLARFTDGKNYPATVKECLENNYVVEFDNGMRITVKHPQLKPWNPLALPPSKYYRKKLTVPQDVNVPSAPQADLALTLKIPKPVGDKEKPALLWSSQSTKMPRQVVRGYDAYYSGLPKQSVGVERQLFVCRVPGCTKRFRKEDMLRQHHRVYHQKRYKLRDQKSQPGPIKKRASREDKIRRRVSADYNSLSQNIRLSAGNTSAVTLDETGKVHRSEVDVLPHDNKIRVGEQTKNTPEYVSRIEAILSTKPHSPEQLPKRKRGRPARKRPAVEEPVKMEELPKVVAPVELTPPPPPTEPEMEEEMPATVIEEVIRCSCGSEEEEGFMIQCEGCFTWQHVACTGCSRNQEESGNVVEKLNKANIEEKKEETQKPVVDGDGYICWVCRNPQNVRKSCQYMYNNDFLTKGKLPSLMNFMNSPEKIKCSAADPGMLSLVLDEVMKMQESLFGIKQKIKLATSGDEDFLLRTWKDLEGGTFGEQSSDSVDKEKSNAPSPTSSEKSDDKAKVSSPKSKLKLGDGKKAFPQKLAGESHEVYVLRCREDLLDHIAEFEEELMKRVDQLTEFVTTLQSSSDEDDAQNVHDLQKSLSVVQALLTRC